MTFSIQARISGLRWRFSRCQCGSPDGPERADSRRASASGACRGPITTRQYSSRPVHVMVSETSLLNSLIQDDLLSLNKSFENLN